jgi:hypothetical protein
LKKKYLKHYFKCHRVFHRPVENPVENFQVGAGKRDQSGAFAIPSAGSFKE